MAANAFQAESNRSLLSGFSMLKPDKMDKLFRRYGKQGYEYYLMLLALGFKLKATNEQYSHFEENYIHENFQVKANVAQPAQGASITCALSTTDLTSDNQYYPRVGDDIMFQTTTGRVIGTIFSIDDTTDPTEPALTIYPKQSTDQFPALTAGDTLFIFSSSFAEGTTQPDSRFSGVTEITNTLKIIKESVATTGTAMNQKLWFDMPWTNANGETEGYYRKSLVDLDARMALQIGGACLFDVQTTNTNLVDSTNGFTIAGTTGLFPAANTYGSQYAYTPGTLNVAAYDQWERTLEQQFVTDKYVMFMQGTHLFQETENMLVDYFNGTDIDYTKKVASDELFGGATSLEASVNFKYFTKSGRTFAFKRMHDFSNLKTYGSPGSKIPKLGLIAPLGTTVDPKSDEKLPAIGYRWSQLTHSREFEMWDIAGAGGNTAKYNTAMDKLTTYSRAHVGAHQVGANRFIVIEPLG